MEDKLRSNRSLTVLNVALGDVLREDDNDNDDSSSRWGLAHPDAPPPFCSAVP